MEGIDRIAEAAILAHFLEQARRHAAAEDVGEDLRTVEVAGMIGLALEAEQNLRIHQVSVLAHFTAGITGGFEDGRRLGTLRQAGEAFLHLGDEGLMIDRAGADHEHAVGGVVA